MTTTYSDEIYKIALNALEITCYMFPLEDWEIEDPEDISKPSGTMRSVVHFQGAAEGGMVFNPSDDLLEALAANMLGEDSTSKEEKEGALCEIANIICGNTVPLFSKNESICTLKPPRIIAKEEVADQLFDGLEKEEVQVLLDEGTIDITLYYTSESVYDQSINS